MVYGVLRSLFCGLIIISLVQACTEVVTVATEVELEDAITCATGTLTSEIIISSEIIVTDAIVIKDVNELLIRGADDVNGEDIKWGGTGVQRRLFEITQSSIDFSHINFRANPVSGGVRAIDSIVNFYKCNISPGSAASIVSSINGGGIYANMSRITLNSSSINNWSCNRGAGIELYISDLLIHHSNFTKNAATLSGGGLYAGNTSSVSVSGNSVFRSNSAGQGSNGGGIFTEAVVSTTIENSSFISNTAGYGSAVFCSGPLTPTTVVTPSLSVRSTSFVENTAFSIGAIYADVVSVLLNVTCADNVGLLAGACIGLGGSASATIDHLLASGSKGNAVICSSCQLLCSYCTFRRNAAVDGGAVYNGAGRVELADSLFVENYVSENGGALFASSKVLDPKVIVQGESWASLNITRCLVTGNQAVQRGGAIYATFTHVIVEETTFRNNSVRGARDTAGGAIYSYTAKVTLNQVDITGSEAVNGGALFCTQASVLRATNTNISDSLAVNSGGGITMDYNSVGDVINVIFDYCRSESVGGALYVSFRSVVNIQDSVFHSVTAGSSGGGVYALNKSPIHITGSTFYNGSALNSGGCVYANGVTMALVGNSFSHCSSYSGGAVFLLFADTTSANNTYTGNFAGEGGAFDMESFSYGHFSGDTFRNNSAVYNGGSVHIEGSVAVMTKCEFAVSFAENGGAIHAVSGTDLNISRCTFLNNSAAYNGGSIFIQSGEDAVVADTVISFNSASAGAGMHVTDTWATVQYTSFLENTAVENGGALFLASKASVIADGCFLSKNSAFEGGAVSLDASQLRATKSIFQGNNAKSQVIVDGLGDLGIDITFSQGGFGGAIYAFLGSVISMNCSYQNNTAYAGGAVSLQLSLFSGYNNIFEGNFAGSGGCVYLFDYNRWLSNRDTFIGNIAVSGGSVVYGYDFGKVIVRNGTLFGSLDIDSSMRSFELASGSLYCGDTVFNGGGDDVSTGLLGRLELTGVDVVFIRCKFDQFRGANGGAVLFQQGSTATISNTTFSNCYAQLAGGAIAFSDVIDITLHSCNFTSNRAVAGGAIFSTDAELDIRDSLFTFNVAQEGGGAIFWEKSIVLESNNQYEFNMASFGNNTASSPVRIAINNPEDFSIPQRSGYMLTSPVEIVVKDYYNQTIILSHTVKDSDVVTVIPIDKDASISGSTLQYLDLQKGITFFSDLAVTLRPGSNVTMEFTVQDQDIENTDLMIFLQECEVGEIVNGMVSAGQKVCEKCSPGTYSFDPSETSCRECPDDATCPGGSVIDVDNGFWRQCQDCHDVVQCIYKQACLGGEITAEQCKEGTEGPTCSVCSDEFFRNGNGGCDQCKSSTSYVDLVFAVLIVLFIASVFYCWRKKEWIREKIEELASKVDEAIEKYELKVYLTKMKILVGFLQILVSIPQVLAVVFPKSFSKFLQAFGLVNLSFLDVFATDCYFNTNFYTSLLITTLSPPLVVIAVDCLLRIRHIIAIRENTLRPSYTYKQKNIDRKILFCIVAFFVFSPVSITIFQTFVCERYEDGKSYLVADSSVECYTDIHKSYVIYAALMILLYPIGIPAYYAYHLMHNRSLINPPTELVVREDEVDIVSAAVIQEEKIKVRESYEKIQGISFLFDSYLPKCWYFEIIECFRRLALTALPVLFLRSTVLQIVLVLIVSLGFSALYMQLRPFVNESDNSVAIVSQWSISLTVLGALCMRVDMSDEHVSSSFSIGVILAIMNGGIIAMTVYLTVASEEDPLSDTLEKVKTKSTCGKTSFDLNIGDVHYDSDDDSVAVQEDIEEGDLNTTKASRRRSSAPVQSLKEFERRVSVRQQILEERDAQKEAEINETNEAVIPSGCGGSPAAGAAPARRNSVRGTWSGNDAGGRGDTLPSAVSPRRISLKGQTPSAPPAPTRRRSSVKGASDVVMVNPLLSPHNPGSERVSEVEDMVIYSRAPFARGVSTGYVDAAASTGDIQAESDDNVADSGGTNSGTGAPTDHKRKSSFFSIFDGGAASVSDARESNVEMQSSTQTQSVTTRRANATKDSDDEDSDDEVDA